MWVFIAFGLVLSFLAMEFILLCVQLVILGLYTVVAHLPCFIVLPIAKKLKLMSFELEEGEIPPYYELVRGLEQVLGCNPAIGSCGPLRTPVSVGC